MRNLLINLTFIFILVLGGASDAFSQDKTQIGTVDTFPAVSTIDITNFGTQYTDTRGNNRQSQDGITSVTVIICSVESNAKLIEHMEPYVPNMNITIPTKEIETLDSGGYILSVKINEESIGSQEIFIP